MYTISRVHTVVNTVHTTVSTVHTVVNTVHSTVSTVHTCIYSTYIQYVQCTQYLDTMFTLW